MFPDTKLIYGFGQFIYPSQDQDYKIKSDAEGLVWEIELENPLKDQLDKISQLGICLFGPSERKITIIALPSRGTEMSAHNASFKAGLQFVSTYYDEIVTDQTLISDFKKFTQAEEENLSERSPFAAALLCVDFEKRNIPLTTREKLIQSLRNNKKMIKEKILSEPTKKNKFFDLGERILKRIEGSSRDYHYELPGGLFNLFTVKKEVLKNL